MSYQQVRTWTLRFEELGEAGLEDRRGQRKKDQTLRTEPEEAQIEIERLGEFSNRYLLEIGRNPDLVMRSGVKFCVSEIRQRQEEVR